MKATRTAPLPQTERPLATRRPMKEAPEMDEQSSTTTPNVDISWWGAFVDEVGAALSDAISCIQGVFR